MTLHEFNHRITGIEDSLKYYSLSLTSNKNDADDLLQDTFLKALQNKDKFNPSTNLKAWTYVIMKNTFINNYRKSHRRNVYMDTLANSYSINNKYVDQGEYSECNFDHEKIMELIQELEVEQKTVFIMNMEGYKYKEIAEKLNLPIGTVKSRIFLTRKKIRDRFTEYRYQQN